MVWSLSAGSSGCGEALAGQPQVDVVEVRRRLLIAVVVRPARLMAATASPAVVSWSGTVTVCPTTLLALRMSVPFEP
jgi:hypothetical protein